MVTSCVIRSSASERTSASVMSSAARFNSSIVKLARTRAMVQIAEAGGITLLHENEKDIFGDLPRRVADLARKIAVRLGLKPTEVQDVMLAGLLHDVGKIGLPDELLAKPLSHMSGDELGIWRKHPAAGQNAPPSRRTCMP